MLEGIVCKTCGERFEDNDKILMHKTKYELGAQPLFFKQTPVTLYHLTCKSEELTSVINNNIVKTIDMAIEFFSQKHIYEFMTTKSAYKEDNKLIMKDLGIECNK